jgi:hypothetical protein
LREARDGAPEGAEEIRRAVLRALTRPQQGLRILVEDVLGQVSRIDAVAQDASGHIVVILIATGPDDSSLLTRTLASRAWLAARIGDWSKLAPALQIRADARVRALMVSPRLGEETRSAVASLPIGFVECRTFRPVRLGPELDVVLDETERSTIPTTTAPPVIGPTPRFRSGLTDRDLGLSAEEREIFESKG